MKKFVIHTYDYDRGSGGIKVMHKLCDLLNKNGFESYLTPIFGNHDFCLCPEYDTPLAPQELLDNFNKLQSSSGLNSVSILYPFFIN